MRYLFYWLAVASLSVTLRAAEPPAAKSASQPTLSTNQPTVITSDHAQGDYVSNYGTFEGNVVVVDSRGTLRADKMIVYFGGTNSIVNGVTNTTRSVQRVIAIGGVVILTQDGKKATCEHADYTTADGKTILTEGHPKVETPDGIVTGKKITIWQGQEQRMDVESDVTDTNRTSLTIFPQDQRKKQE